MLGPQGGLAAAQALVSAVWLGSAGLVMYLRLYLGPESAAGTRLWLVWSCLCTLDHSVLGEPVILLFLASLSSIELKACCRCSSHSAFCSSFLWSV